MIKVLGHWELGWNAPLSEYDLWNFPLRSYGIDEWYMAPVSGINKKLTEVANLEAVIAANPELVPVFIDENGTTPLKNFNHPENALYILGKSGLSPWRAYGEVGVSVRIETPVGGGMLWPHQCIALVLHDRVSKK